MFARTQHVGCQLTRSYGTECFKHTANIKLLLTQSVIKTKINKNITLGTDGIQDNIAISKKHSNIPNQQLKQ